MLKLYLIQFGFFCPSQKDGHKGDYYKVFNRENYIQWFTTQLLSNLHEPSLIMLYNARYHKCKPISTPHPSKMKKGDILLYLNRIGIAYDSQMTGPEARCILRKWQQENIDPEIVQIAAEQGRKDTFTPLHCSDLQPIELLWARVKNAVAKEYTKQTTLSDVRHRQEHQFSKLDTDEGREAVLAIINHVDEVIAKFAGEIYASKCDYDSHIDGVETETDSEFSDSFRTLTELV